MSYNYKTNIDSPNFTPSAQATAVFGMPRIIEGITLHWWGDPNTNPSFDGIVNYLARPNGNTSAHFVASGTNRQVACIIGLGDVAWHSGSAWGNARTIGIELDPRGRPEDLDVVAELIADIRSAVGDVPLYWHNYFVGTQCPGVYTALMDHIDELSYTKYSHATEWGQGGNKNQPAPVVPTPTPISTPVPVVTLYKLVIDGKQVAAYSSDTNAYTGYVEYGSKGSITFNGVAVTKDLIAKFTTPSPTTGQPDSGLPVAEKHDYSEENNAMLKTILKMLGDFIAKFNIFGK
jgi:hypothetical protein